MQRSKDYELPYKSGDMGRRSNAHDNAKSLNHLQSESLDGSTHLGASTLKPGGNSHLYGQRARKRYTVEQNLESIIRASSILQMAHQDQMGFPTH